MERTDVVVNAASRLRHSSAALSPCCTYCSGMMRIFTDWGAGHESLGLCGPGTKLIIVTPRRLAQLVREQRVESLKHIMTTNIMETTVIAYVDKKLPYDSGNPFARAGLLEFPWAGFWVRCFSGLEHRDQFAAIGSFQVARFGFGQVTAQSRYRRTATQEGKREAQDYVALMGHRASKEQKGPRTCV